MPDEPENSSRWSRADVLAVAGIVVAVAIGYTTTDTRKVTGEAMGFLRAHWLPSLLAVTILFAVFAIVRSRSLSTVRGNLAQLLRELAAAKEKVSDLSASLTTALAEIERLKKELSESIRYKKYDRGRWRKIGALTYGFIPYQPLLREDEGGLAVGVGVALLDRLVEGVVQLRAYGRASRWEEIDEQFEDDQFAVMATPLIATFERTKSMAFSAPLFFSNMGLFVNKAYADHCLQPGSSHERMMEEIGRGTIRLLAIPGEISQNLAQHYVAPEQWATRIEERKSASLGSLFDEIANAQIDRPIAIFCESIHSHFNKHCESGRVVNVLQTGSILYPVCFAMRQGDYQLRNLLNMRLLSLASNGGALRELARCLAERATNGNLTRDITEEEVLRHYVDRLPDSLSANAASGAVSHA